MEHTLSRRSAIIGIGAGALSATVLAHGIAAQGDTSTPAASSSSILDPAIGLIEAQEAALKDHESATVRKVELKYERKTLVWEVELDNRIEVTLDATTGEIINTDHDD